MDAGARSVLRDIGWCSMADLLPGTTYYYRVVAINEDGTSPGAVRRSRLRALLSTSWVLSRLVRARPICGSSYANWLAVEVALGACGDVGHRALGFLITSSWVLGEASAMGMSVSDAEVEKQFNRLKNQ